MSVWRALLFLSRPISAVTKKSFCGITPKINRADQKRFVHCQWRLVWHSWDFFIPWQEGSCDLEHKKRDTDCRRKAQPTDWIRHVKASKVWQFDSFSGLEILSFKGVLVKHKTVYYLPKNEYLFYEIPVVASCILRMKIKPPDKPVWITLVKRE